jgi:hypothetical protein
MVVVSEMSVPWAIAEGLKRSGTGNDSSKL